MSQYILKQYQPLTLSYYQIYSLSAKILSFVFCYMRPFVKMIFQFMYAASFQGKF